MLCKIMAANCGSRFQKFTDFYYIYRGLSYFFPFWIRNLRKLHFTNLANLKNLNLNLDCTVQIHNHQSTPTEMCTSGNPHELV